MHAFLSFVTVVHAAGVIEDAVPISTIISNILGFILGAVGVVGMLSFAVSGFLYIASQGNESAMKQAKQAMIYSVIGVAVVATALIIVRTLADMV
jgi:hypothetical protein